MVGLNSNFALTKLTHSVLIIWVRKTNSEVAGLARMGLRYIPTSSLEIVVAGELRSNLLWGDETRFGLMVDEDVFRQPRDADSGRVRWSPRALMATAVIPIGRVSCGHQAIHWGTGMLVNDGAQTPEFGDAG